MPAHIDVAIASVTLQLVLVTPTLKSDPETGLHVTFGCPVAPITIGGGNVTTTGLPFDDEPVPFEQVIANGE
jgi:hypothetical protein